jgi:hypothetical protein
VVESDAPSLKDQQAQEEARVKKLQAKISELKKRVRFILSAFLPPCLTRLPQREALQKGEAPAPAPTKLPAKKKVVSPPQAIDSNKSEPTPPAQIKGQPGGAVNPSAEDVFWNSPGIGARALHFAGTDPSNDVSNLNLLRDDDLMDEALADVSADMSVLMKQTSDALALDDGPDSEAGVLDSVLDDSMEDDSIVAEEEETVQEDDMVKEQSAVEEESSVMLDVQQAKTRTPSLPKVAPSAIPPETPRTKARWQLTAEVERICVCQKVYLSYEFLNDLSTG